MHRERNLLLIRLHTLDPLKSLAAIIALAGFSTACERAPSTPDCIIEPAQSGRLTGLKAPPPPPSVDGLMDRTREKVSMASWIVPGRRHHWVPDSHAVQSVDGGLHLHGVARSARKSARYRVQVAVLVGYEPVPARITLWSGDRSRKLDTVQASGTWLEQKESSIAVDVELPAGTVPVGSWDEVQTVLEVAPSSQLDTSDADVRRWIVRAGKAPPAPVDCEWVAARDSEVSITGLDSRGVSSAYAVPIPTPTGWPDEKQAARTARQAHLELRLAEDETVAAVFLAAGEPARPPWFRRARGKGGLVSLGEVPLQKPGPAFVVTWREPFAAKHRGATNFRSSNVVWSGSR